MAYLLGALIGACIVIIFLSVSAYILRLTYDKNDRKNLGITVELIRERNELDRDWSKNAPEFKKKKGTKK